MVKPICSLLNFLLLVSYASSLTLSGCETSKHCFTFPNGCDPTSPECLFFSWIWNGTAFDMELSGGSGVGNTYAAVAFGQINDMASADLYYCTGNSLEWGAIIQSKARPTEFNINNENWIRVVSATTNNGVAECSFSRDAKNSESTTTNHIHLDLTDASHYILLARGGIAAGSMQYHGGNRIISDEKLNMASPVVSSGLPTEQTEENTAHTTPRQTSFTTPNSVGETSTSSEEQSRALETTTTDGKTISKNCLTIETCFDFPKGCEHGKPDCYAFMWNYDSDSMKFSMEIIGGVGNGNTYVAIAFGLENKMQDADLYYCTGQSLESGVITELHKKPTKLDSKSGITNSTATTTNGVSKCTFTRDASVMKTITSGSKDFNLANNEYYILLAHGNMKDGGLTYHGRDSRAVSDNAIKLGSGCASIKLTKVGFGWMLLLTIVVTSLKIGE